MSEYIENDKQHKKKAKYPAPRPSITVPVRASRIPGRSTRISWISVPHNVLLLSLDLSHACIREYAHQMHFLICPFLSIRYCRCPGYEILSTPGLRHSLFPRLQERSEEQSAHR